MSRIKTSQDGFTLLEVLIAVTILAVALLGLAQLQITGIKVNSQANTMAVATAVAQGVFEDVQGRPGDDPLFAAPAKVDAVWPGSPSTIPAGGVYDISYSTTPGFNGIPNMTKIDIRVESQQELSTAIGFRKRIVTLTALKRTF